MTTVSAPRLLLPDGLRGPGAVVVENGHVVDVLDQVPGPGADHVRLETGCSPRG